MKHLLPIAALLVMAAAPIPAPVPGMFSGAGFGEQGGEAVYRGLCAGCHMQDGRGAQGAGAYPALADDPRLEAAAYPIFMVLHGQNAMPGFARSLTDQQVADVVGYIRSHFGNHFTDPPTPEDIKAAR